MATAPFPQPVHEFSSRVPWVLYAAGVLIPTIVVIAVLLFGYPK